ncbi:MAG TPA: sigma-70 family RNA polymerase sigma factor [Alphaproteobacteria bacterium]|jgi:RNA polymerase sigma factor (sigma-70 family)|nr:sigma-70 family RNA polymerase sigma factor [Alphaproteobacteria bacterium]
MDNHLMTEYMRQTAEGDQRAFRALSEALGQKIFALAFRLLSGDRSTAEDVSQDVLIKLWQFAPKWQAGGSVQAWVSRLTYNACMDVHRARKNKNDEIPDHLSVPETANATLLTSEYRSLLLQAIDRLPDRQKEAMLLTYFHENSRREVAANMETTEKAVEHLIARGLKALGTLIPANINGERHDIATHSY